MIIELENGWEEYTVRICEGCRHRMYAPGGGDLALKILREGSCGHDCPGDA
jgi:hypothetical protein